MQWYYITVSGFIHRIKVESGNSNFQNFSLDRYIYSILIAVYMYSMHFVPQKESKGNYKIVSACPSVHLSFRPCIRHNLQTLQLHNRWTD